MASANQSSGNFFEEKHMSNQTPKFGEWLPIESAPKDGTRVLIFTPDALDIENTFSATFDDGEWWESRALQDGTSRSNVDCDPTHWMPLPPPPPQSIEGE
jgi:hypothetical protein